MKPETLIEVDRWAAGEHEAVHGDITRYRFDTIDSLPLTDWQRKCVLEWFACKIWYADMETGGDPHCKSYDPLLFDGNEAHSYVFNLHDGGRCHSVPSLNSIEEGLFVELKQIISEAQDETH